MSDENGSLVLTAAVGAMVVGIFQVASPGIANVRVSQPNDQDLATSERGASWMAAALVGGVAVISREPLVFIQGSLMIIGLAWWHRHANAVNPQMEAMKRHAGVGAVDTVPLPGSGDAILSEPSAVDTVSTSFEGVF